MERKGWENCTLPERLNNKADRLAKDALLSAISGGPIMTCDYPFKLVCLRLSGERVCGSPRQGLEWDWGYQTALNLYADKGIIRAEDFHMIWWDGLRAAMARYPKMYRVRLTKHLSDCGGTNVQLYYWSGGVHSPKCKFCTTVDKYSSHICHCDSMFCILVKELVSWLKETLAEHSVTKTIETYLLSCGEVPVFMDPVMTS